MRVRGDNAPSNAFSLEEQPNKPGVALVWYASMRTPSRLRKSGTS